MIEQAILALCLNMQTPELSKYYAACQQTLMAASIQSKLKPEIEAYQQNIEKMIAKQTGEKVWSVVGLAYAMYIKQQLAFTLSIKPVADNLYVAIGQTNQSATLTWSF